MRFVNRQNELSFLEKVNNNGGFQFVPIYGRRRIGKTRLIFEHHVSLIYEDVCMDLCKDFAKDGLIQYTSIGKWWSKDEEIDIVALDEETKTAYFGECKWSNKKVGEDIYQALIRKSQLIDWHKDKRKEKFILFSKNGFTSRMIEISKKENVLLVHKERVIK